MQRVISLSELVRNADKIAADLETQQTVYRVRRAGGRGMVLLDEDYYESWIAAIELMQQPDWKETLEQGRRDIAEGRTVPLEKVLRELGLEDSPHAKSRAPSRRASRVRGTKGQQRTARARKRSSKR
jgi:PHD/YefM family antitoxin component YafN of YafNO toxin-antitoxin module